MRKLILLSVALCICFTIFLASGCSNNNSGKNDSQETNSSSNSVTNTFSSEAPSQTSSVIPSTNVENQNGSSNLQNSSQNSSYTQAEQTILTKASNIINWQLDNGGWGKNQDKTSTFNGYPSGYSWEVGGKYVGTIDNDATYTEMRMLANAYEISKDSKYKVSFDKGYTFLKKLQYTSGGFSQIYPHNGKYNDLATLNDNAMVNTVLLLQDMANNKAPFKSITTEQTRTECRTMVDKAIDFFIKSQITVQGVKAGWCAQYDPVTYEPKDGRVYELASVSGAESIGVIKLLLSQTENANAQTAASQAIAWFKAHKIANKTYSKKNPPKFFTDAPGQDCWFRFYSLTDGTGFYCDRAGKVYYDIDEFYLAAPERATGYDWAGNWLAKAGLAG